MRSTLLTHAASFRLLAVLLVAAVATGLSFALWMNKGPRIFMALVESGMSWCF